MIFCVHTVGTSILNNILRKKVLPKEYDSKLLNAMANISDSDKEQLTSEQKALLEAFNQLGCEQLKDLDRQSISAELNAFYHSRHTLETTEYDQHYLLHTDTVVGEVAANILKKIMEQDGYCQVAIHKMEKLNTQSTECFHEGIKKLFGWLKETLSSCKKSNTKVIFNLTGGFKALQGYMNIAGMFYADKMIYIFENQKEVIEIPKFPISIDDFPAKTYAKEFLIAEKMEVVEAHYLEKLDSMYKEVADDTATLSPIGLLVWQQCKNNILSNNLLEFDHLDYEPTFQKDFKDRKRDVVQLQECLAKVSYLLQQNNNDTSTLKRDGGLKYENYADKNIGHFRVSQETRVSCQMKNGKLYLRRFGAHDYVNNNP